MFVCTTLCAKFHKSFQLISVLSKVLLIASKRLIQNPNPVNIAGLFLRQQFHPQVPLLWTMPSQERKPGIKLSAGNIFSSKLRKGKVMKPYFSFTEIKPV